MLYIYKYINILEAGFPCFCRQAKAKNSQANGLYLLVGLYLLDPYVLVCDTCYPDSLAENNTCYPIV